MLVQEARRYLRTKAEHRAEPIEALANQEVMSDLSSKGY